MSFSFRLPRRTPKPAPKHARTARTPAAPPARLPLSPGMPGPGAAMYLPAPETRGGPQR